MMHANCTHNDHNHMIADYKKRFYINLIFIDTNMYEGKWCQGLYPESAYSEQDKWLGQTLLYKSDVKVWNIVIGHIPFLSNPHKKDMNIRKVQQLYNLIQKYSNQIDLYMCADEHNQQYITQPGMPPQIISGSGGASLDENIFNFFRHPFVIGLSGSGISA